MLGEKMLSPTKYLDLRSCLLHVAASMILELRQYRAIRISELDDKIQMSLGENAKYSFLPALSFLFITGIIDYDIATDTVFMLKTREVKSDEAL